MSDLNKLKQLESQARLLEPSFSERSGDIKKVVDYTQRFLSDLDQRKAYNQSTENGSGLYDSPISEEPTSISHLLDIFDKNVTEPGLNPASARHFGYIPGGGIFASALGDFLADVTNRYAGIFFASPGAVRMENMLIQWMCDLIGYPLETSGGNLTSGGSIANLTALIAARDHFGLKGRDYEKAVIYVTEHVHHCIDKAINIAGMREAVIRHIPMDSRFRMEADALETRIHQDKRSGLNPFMVIASCGTTDTGAVDPLDDIGDIAHKHNLWFHVDGAYGGFFILSEKGRKVIKGLNKADSVIVDPHKGLFLPYGTGAVLVKNKETLFQSLHYTANYMQDSFAANEELSPADLSPELSKHFRGLRMWLPLKLFGLSPFRAALDEKIMLARYFYEKINEIDGFETGPFPELSILFFRYVPESGDPDVFNEQLIQKILEDGRVFFSSTKINGSFYIRLAVVSFRTHRDDIDLALEVLEETVRKLEMK